MADHGSRAHAEWSASASSRLWACPGSLQLIRTIDVPDRESSAAAWGTACHQVSEKCLRQNKDAAEFIGSTEHTKEHSFEVDDEMAETAQVYVDYVRGGIMHAFQGDEERSFFEIEQKFSLAPLEPPFDGGGTADALIYFAAGKALEVIDLKGGRGVVVEAKGNPQLRTYALGAMLAHPGLDVDRVTVTIVQPRAPHKDGRIRSETFHVADLIEWTADLMEAMRKAAMAAEEHRKLKWTLDEGVSPKGLTPEENFASNMKLWEAYWLKAGSHCQFCPAAAVCPEVRRASLEAAHVWFDDLGYAQKPNTPDTFPPEEIAKILAAADMIDNWLNSVRAYAHQQAEGGVVIPGYQLVAKQARRKWADEETAIATVSTVLSREEALATKLKSPAQIEKLLGGKVKAAPVLQGLTTQESSGTNLVRADKSSRPPVKSTVDKFDILT